MFNVIRLPISGGFSFHEAVTSHGWYALAPFKYDAEQAVLSFVFIESETQRPVTVEVHGQDSELEIKYRWGLRNDNKIADLVKHILRIDEDFSKFYEKADRYEPIAWARTSFSGRLLRSPTVFEDMVKTLCTTNCSWQLTKIMTGNLVDKLGENGEDGHAAFPTPHAMAGADENFYRNEIRSGYRSRYLIEFAEAVAGGSFRPEILLERELPTDEVAKRLKSVKGFGKYAVDNMLKLLGRYDGLALDSFLRGEFYKRHNKGRPCKDERIERHYKKFGEWKGLAIWCEMMSGRE